MKELDLTDFPSVDKDRWVQLAQNQLKGDDPMSALAWESHGISGLSPYYDASDLDNLSYLTDFFSTLESHRWKLYEKIQVIDNQSANRMAINALMGGCDGVIFNLGDQPYNASLLNDIDPSICDIFFSSTDSAFTPEIGKRLVQKPIAFASPIDQLITILKADTKEIICRYAFNDFFLEIASIRALRYLLHTEKTTQAHIHTRVHAHSSAEHQWFLNTTAGLAAILGGSHSIDMPTAIGDRRITRNVGNLLRDESGISQYEDQCGGSYLVESLTDKIIKGVKEKL